MQRAIVCVLGLVFSIFTPQLLAEEEEKAIIQFQRASEGVVAYEEHHSLLELASQAKDHATLMELVERLYETDLVMDGFLHEIVSRIPLEEFANRYQNAKLFFDDSPSKVNSLLRAQLYRVMLALEAYGEYSKNPEQFPEANEKQMRRYLDKALILYMYSLFDTNRYNKPLGSFLSRALLYQITYKENSNVERDLTLASMKRIRNGRWWRWLGIHLWALAKPTIRAGLMGSPFYGATYFAPDSVGKWVLTGIGGFFSFLGYVWYYNKNSHFTPDQVKRIRELKLRMQQIANLRDAIKQVSCEQHLAIQLDQVKLPNL